MKWSSMMSSGTDAVRGGSAILEWSYNLRLGWWNVQIRQRAAMEGECYLCYIPSSISLEKRSKEEKKKDNFSFLCNRNISTLSNYLLRYLNFYAIIHFPEHLCCLQPKADFKSEPLSLLPLDSRIQICLVFSFLVCEIKQLWILWIH